jgi:hypothetical protein
MRGPAGDRAGAPGAIPAQGLPMRMWGSLVFERVAEHIVKEAHQATERL